MLSQDLLKNEPLLGTICVLKNEATVCSYNKIFSFNGKQRTILSILEDFLAFYRTLITLLMNKNDSSFELTNYDTVSRTKESDESICKANTKPIMKNRKSRKRCSKPSIMCSPFNFTMFVCVFLIIILQCSATDVPAAPRFLKQPSFSGGIVEQGQNKILLCNALGAPTPHYQWLKDGKPLGEFSKNSQLRITNITSESSGAYQCVAKNVAGAIVSEKTELTVAYIHPLEEINNVTLVVREGHAALVQPPAISSVPKATASWEKLGSGSLPERKYITTTQNALVILSADKSDAGIYKLVFSNNQLGREEKGGFAEIVVEDGHLEDSENPVIVIPPRNSTFQQHSQATLECIVNARPLNELKIDWSKDGINISQAGIPHYSYISNQLLDLLDVKPSYSGFYQCKAYLRSHPERVVTAEAYVTVNVKPSIIDGPDSETVSELGHDVLLNCKADGHPTPTVMWLRNSLVVGNDPLDRYQRLENGSLKISNLKSEDSGIFQCLVENIAGEATANTWLHVKMSPPYLLTSPMNLTVLDGKDAQIPCEVSGSPKPSISWTINGTLPVHSAGRAQILDNGALVLQSVEPRDSGFYSCSRSNSAGTVSGSAYLTILVRTQIVRPPADTKVILGSTAELQCKVSNDPLVPYEVSWYFEGKRVGDQNGGRFQPLPDGTLRISFARNTDVGAYTCKVTSPGGNDTRSARLDVLELPFPPSSVRAEILNTTPKSVKVSWSKAFDGNSPLTMYIVQMQNIPLLIGIPEESQSGVSDSINQPVDPLAPWVTAVSNISVEQRFVIVKDLKAASNYRFRVSAVNGVGEGNPSQPTNLIVLPSEPPSSPPQGVIGAARTSTSIMLQWQPPAEDDRNGDLLGYVVRYKLAGYVTSPWAYENVTNEVHHNILLQDLIIWKTYEIQVAAFNKKGVGTYSEPIRIRTKEGVPEAEPTNVRATTVNSTAVKVWWNPPNQQKINGMNQGYKVETWRGVTGQPDALTQRVSVPPSLVDPSAEQNTIITDLKKYTWYNITVLCFTSEGDGPRSDYVEIITDQDLPDEVGSLKFEDILDTSVKVFWTPPLHSNGIILGYTLSYFAKELPSDVITKNLSANTMSFVAASLLPITAYSFQIYARTAIGAGPAKSATIQSGIPPVLPGSPTRLAVSNINTHSVVLQFTPGFDGNSSITKWTIEASTKRRNESSWFVVDEVSDPDATNLVVENLIPFTEYRLRLLATNVVGASPPSDPTKYFQTIQAPPSHPPFNVTVRAVNATALRVRWTPLQQFEWYGIPRGYNISFSPTHDVSLLNLPKNVSKLYQWRILEDHNANSFVLQELEEFTEYEVFVQAFNDVGISTSSSTATDRTRESVPAVGPSIVEANSTSSTTIVVKWSEIPAEHRNGILEGYKILYGAKTVPFQTKTIEGNATFIATLIELKKYTAYTIQVLGYTRIGDGNLSVPPLSVTTFEDVPGMPSNVSFPDVSTTTARIIWDVPSEPNGEILAYLVSYGQNQTGAKLISKELQPTDRTLKAFNLKPETYYVFAVTAQTREGWGQPASAVVFTTNKREAPQSPSEPRVSLSQIQARQITFSWTPGSDGFAPLRFYTVQISEEDSHWKTLQDKVDPTANTYTITSLKPFRSYKFRLQATNDIGASGWSPASNETFTLSAAPGARPQKVSVTPYTTTSVTVEWKLIPLELWNGDTHNPGYRVEYCLISAYAIPQSTDCPSKRVPGLNSTSVSLENLEQDKMYEIKVIAYNGQGDGPPSLPVSVYVGEAVPTGSPRDVRTMSLSSSEIKVTWKPPLENQQNGDLSGYKICYQSEIKGTPEELVVVPVHTLSYVLMDLSKFRDYRVQILAFNPAGDGPRSQPQFVKTMEDLPGAPGGIFFADVTMTSLNISWSPPKNPNGRIRGYQITYETALNDSNLSKHIQEKVKETYLSIKGLREMVPYKFTVKAETIGLGPPSTASITTGPQTGSPGPPQEVQIQTTQSSATLHWVNGVSGSSPLTGYLIEASEENSEWLALANLNQGPQQSYTISFQNLLPSKHYQFRLFSKNKFGISPPAIVHQPVATPSKMYLEYRPKLPFYREVWFLVMLASATVIIIILVIAILCVKSKAYKYKQEAAKSIQDDRISMDDGGFATFELRQSKRGTLCKNTLSRKGGNSVIAKSPPRPSPASVTYSDEEDAKGYDDNCDSSSLTEKPSEISSTDSQATDSDRESDTKSEPHSFVNHYANVNDTFRQSWKRQRPHVKPPSYSDSEPEGSLAVSLNGGKIIMNNLAGSRAPLPGFSSFV